jgi:hypothetical protein
MFRETPRPGKLKPGRYDPFAIDEEFYPEGWLTPKVQIKTYWDEDAPKDKNDPANRFYGKRHAR